MLLYFLRILWVARRMLELVLLTLVSGCLPLFPRGRRHLVDLPILEKLLLPLLAQNLAMSQRNS